MVFGIKKDKNLRVRARVRVTCRVGVAVWVTAQVVETPVNTSNSPSQDYTTNLDDHSNRNIDSPGFKSFTVICKVGFGYM